MTDDRLNQLAKDIDRELGGMLPTVVARMKKRLHLAYLYGLEDGRQDQTIDTREMHAHQMAFQFTKD